MIDIKSLIYTKLHTDTVIVANTWENIYPGIAPRKVLKDIKENNKAVITYNEISGTTDLVGQRNELYQISIRSQSFSLNDIVKNRVIDIFNRLKDENFKYVFLDRINETGDPETSLSWTHITLQFKLHDTNF